MIKSAIQQKTIGGMLKQKRRERDLSLEQIAESIKIKAEYLKALEENDYNVFPSDVYAKGFLKNYSKFLGIRSEHALALYRRDNKAVVSTSNKPNLNIKSYFNKIVITPNRIFVLLGIIALATVIFYLSSYIGIILRKPTITLTLPINISAEGEYDFQTTLSTVEFAGKVDSPGTKITINGTDITPSTINEFLKTFDLTETETKFTIIAVSAFGRESKLTINVKKNINNITDTVNELTGIVTVNQDNTKITVYSDGMQKISKTYDKNSTIDFFAVSNVRVVSNKIGSFSITINGIKELVAESEVEYSIIDGQILKN